MKSGSVWKVGSECDIGQHATGKVTHETCLVYGGVK